MSDKSAWEKKFEAQIDEWKADIAKMQARARQASADAQIDYEAEIAQLKARQSGAEDELKKLQALGGAAWDDVRKGAEESWDTMSRAMKDAWSRFG
jgi:multidrug resistance efflux pump